MNVAAFIVAAMNIHQIIECSSPESANVRHSFLSFSHLIFYFIHIFCCLTSHDESFGICHFLGVSTIRVPRSIMNYLSVPYGLRISVEKSISMNEDKFVAPHSKKFYQVSPDRSCVVTSLFPLLRRPRTIIIRF